MSPTRTINVVTLSLILLLAGCFGLGDSAEADSNDDYEPNAAPVISLEQPFSQNSPICDGNFCNITMYHAVVDPDGDLLTKGWDYDLDGIIDFEVQENRGLNDLSIPISNMLNLSYDYYTSIAFIAIDSEDFASAELVNLGAGVFVYSSTGPYFFYDRDASGTLGETTNDALVHIQLTSGDSLNWATLRVSIVVDGGASNICDADEGDAACVFMTDGETTWDVAEEITIKENGQDLCNGQDGGCDVAVTLTKIGVGNEGDMIIATVNAYADATQ